MRLEEPLALSISVSTEILLESRGYVCYIKHSHRDKTSPLILYSNIRNVHTNFRPNIPMRADSLSGSHTSFSTIMLVKVFFLTAHIILHSILA